MVHSMCVLVKANDQETSLQQIGNLIRESRLKADLTQKELAQKLGISAPTINKYENNGQQVTIEVLSKIAHVLELDLLVGFQT